MANYTETFNSKLDWAMPFQRTGNFPLDRTDLFSSYADAVKYAAGDTSDPDSRALCGTSYVGQVITVFENDVVTVYKIEADRSLSEVGKATLGDQKTIDLGDGNKLSLHNFGKQYYKWVNATGEPGSEGYVAGHHELQIVDQDNPWISGLEPKSVSAVGGGFELAWYQPSPTTVEGLNSIVNTIQTDMQTANTNINKLQTEVGNDGTVGEKTGLHKKVADLETDVSAAKTKLAGIEEGAQKNVQSDWNAEAGDALILNKPTKLSQFTDDITEGVLTQVAQDLTSYYKKTETYSKEEVNNLLAPIHSMGISVVTELPTENIDTYTVYLVKKGDAEGDIYNEYLYVNSKWELLGNTAVNLDGYVQKTELAVVATTGSFNDLKDKPLLVSKTTQTLTANSTTVDVAYTGTVVSTLAKDATTGEQLIVDVDIASDKVTFSIAQVYANNIVCDVFALA